jgi:hypothetical protein
MQTHWHKALGIFILLAGVACEVSLIPIAIGTIRDGSQMQIAGSMFLAVFVAPYLFLNLGLRSFADKSFAIMSLGTVLILGVGVFLPVLLLRALTPLSRPLAVMFAVGALAAGLSGGIAVAIVGWRRLRRDGTATDKNKQGQFRQWRDICRRAGLGWPSVLAGVSLVWGFVLSYFGGFLYPGIAVLTMVGLCILVPLLIFVDVFVVSAGNKRDFPTSASSLPSWIPVLVILSALAAFSVGAWFIMFGSPTRGPARRQSATASETRPDAMRRTMAKGEPRPLTGTARPVGLRSRISVRRQALDFPPETLTTVPWM